MNEPKICPAGGRQGAQVMEHWGSDATQVARKGIPLCVYHFTLFYVYTCLLPSEARRGVPKPWTWL